MRVVKLLNRIGIFFIICSLFFIILLSRKNEIYINVGSVFLFIGILLSIPDYWLFFINKKRNDERLADYWFANFLALPLALVLLIIYFFIRLLS